jgi:pimeloyl-ACP methyl ester carboxylesterase
MILTSTRSNPWIVLIHGLGVSEAVWSDPLSEKGLFIPFKTLLGGHREVVPATARLAPRFNVATWTQARGATIDGAAEELRDLITALPTDNFILLGHSRGGLVARRAVQTYGLKPGAIVCLATPHYGTNCARLAVDHSHTIARLMPSSANTAASAVELCGNSSVIRSLNGSERIKLENGIPHFDLTGDSTLYFARPPRFKGVPVFSLLNQVRRFIGRPHISEWAEGEGDGLVSVGAAKSPLTAEKDFYVLPVNHITILIDNRVWDIVNTILNKIGN